MGKKGRVFNISQYLNHPVTGEKLVDMEDIKNALNSYKTIKKWAYIIHDKDVWTEEDERKKVSFHAKAGEIRPPHVHIVLNTENNYMDVSIIGKWLNIPDNFIDLPKGRGAFLDCVEYLTHEDEKQQALGKYLYSDEEVFANFDFRKELQERADKMLKYGAELSYRDQIRHDVMYGGLTLIQARERDKINYLNDYKELQRLRLEYINAQKPPRTRMNFYIDGKGGIGKGLLSTALAKYLAKTFNPDLTEEDEMIFEVGSGNALFEGYDGQPVIIWDDKRAFELLQILGGRGNVFTVFDTHPRQKKRQNIKYSSVNLCNTFNIINGIQPYPEFLDGLAGEYKDRDGQIHKIEDKSQAYRRFPLIIPIQEDYFTLLFNKGYFENTRDFMTYLSYGNITANFRRLTEMLENQPEKKEIVERQTLRPIMEFTQKGLNKPKKELSDEEISEEFKNYGKTETQILADKVGENLVDKNGQVFVPTDDEDLMKKLKGEINENKKENENEI